MATAKEHLLETNRAQTVSETDDFTPDRYRQMCAHLPVHACSILDAGCNTGRGGIEVKRALPGATLVGLDCVEERISALDKTVYAKAIRSFSSQLPVEDRTFDAILAGEFLEHVPPAEIDATLAEFFRVLKLRGRLVMTTPNPNYLKNRLKHLSVLSEASHLTQHYPDSLRGRLRAIGFSGVKIFGSGRMIRYVGQHFPVLSVYGSYLVQGDKW